MATTARTTTTYPTDATGTNNFRASYVNPLRAVFVAGTKVTHSHLNTLRDAYIAFQAHTHEVIDYRSIRTFGNNGPGTVVAANPRVSSAMPSATTPSSVSAATKIRASEVNSHIDSINQVRDHTHPIFDDP